MPRLRTDWICIATAGLTADGREIKEEWLLDAAETYNRQTYTALIWPNHDILYRQYTYNFGEVDGLKTERVDGALKLFAQLMPNDWLISSNSMGQNLFTSIEVMDNFAGSGKSYMTGLCVTDVPASLGTDRLMFNMGSHQSAVSRGSTEAFSLGGLHNASDASDREQSFLQRIFSRNKENQSKNTEEDEMTREQFEALIGRMDKQDSAITGIQEQVKAFSTVTQSASPDNSDPQKKDTPAAGVTVEQFTQLEGKLDGLVQKFDQMASTSTTKKPDINPGEENKVWL